MANALSVSLHALGAEVADGNGAAIDCGSNRSAVALVLTISALVGNLTVFVQTSPDGTTGWRDVGQFDVAAGIGQQSYSFDQCDRYVRARWDLGTSATFSVAGEAHQLFALRGDLTNGSIRPEALTGIDARVIANALIKASCRAETELATAYPMPITKWPLDVTQNAADIAVFFVMKHRGFNPDADTLLIEAYKDALAWFRSVAKGTIRPPGLTPPDNIGVKVATSDVEEPQEFKPKFSNNWGDFG